MTDHGEPGAGDNARNFAVFPLSGGPFLASSCIYCNATERAQQHE
jgi:hypothetical protein